MKFASQETVQKRIDICNSCDKQTLGICTKCGCVILLKTKKKNSVCPINKWNQEIKE